PIGEDEFVTTLFNVGARKVLGGRAIMGLGQTHQASNRGADMSRALTWMQTLLLGAAMILGLGIAAFEIFAIGQRQLLWSEPFRLRAGFGQIHGVEVGARVRVLGKDAGSVEAVILPQNPSGKVQLVLRVDGALASLIRSDACAQIVAEGMVGGKVVEIAPGSDSAPCVANNTEIACQPSADLTDL